MVPGDELRELATETRIRKRPDEGGIVGAPGARKREGASALFQGENGGIVLDDARDVNRVQDDLFSGENDMATPEGKVKAAISRELKRLGAYYHMPVQNGMGSPTLDYVGCINGHFFAIEAKSEVGTLTARQELTIEAMKRAGALVLVIRGVDTIGKIEASFHREGLI